MMKFKLKALVAALAMAAGSAFAAIPDGSTGNGGLFLEVYDGSGATYIRDLGITMNQFGTAERASGGFTANVDTGGASVFANPGNGAVVNGQLTFSADSTFASFLSGKDTSLLRWEVLAVDFNGTSAADELRVLYTTPNNDQANAALAGTLVNNTGIANSIGAVNGVLINGTTGINFQIGSAQSYVTSNPADVSYATFLNSTFNGKAPNLNTFSTIGTDSFLTYATRSGSANTAEGIFVTYGTAANPFPVAMDAGGTLTFGATVAAVPEPGTWAMLVAGLMMVGGIARRRTSV